MTGCILLATLGEKPPQCEECGLPIVGTATRNAHARIIEHHGTCRTHNATGAVLFELCIYCFTRLTLALELDVRRLGGLKIAQPTLGSSSET